MKAVFPLMRKVLSCAFVGMTIVSTTLYAASEKSGFDLGGSIENSSSLNIPAGALSAKTPDKTDKPDLNHSNMDQANTLRVWFTQYFSETVSILLKVNVQYKAHYTFVSEAPDATPLEPFFPDLEYLVFHAGAVNPFGSGSKFAVWIGRTDFRDLSGSVLNSKLDGIIVETGFPGFGVHLGIGTSALGFKHSSAIAISNADVLERTQISTWNNTSTLLAPPRLIGNLEFEFKRLVLDQTLKIGIVGQLDLRPTLEGTDSRFRRIAKAGDSFDPQKPDMGAPVSMIYAGFGLTGKIAGPLYYNAWGYAGFGQSLTKTGIYTPATGGASPQPARYQTYNVNEIVNGAGSISLTLLFPEALYSVFDLTGTLGSWDTDASGPSVGTNGTEQKNRDATTQYNGFFGVTRTGGQLIFNPQPVNMLTTQVSYSFKPFAADAEPAISSFQAVLIATMFVRPTATQIGENELIEKSPDAYVGTEADLVLNMRPSSDLGASVGFGLFIPNESALDRKVETKLQVSLNVSL